MRPAESAPLRASRGRRWAERASATAFAAFPFYVAGFGYRSVWPHPGLHYLLDVVAWCAGFYLLGVLILSRSNAPARRLLMGLVCGVPIAFHWANLLFFYFFWDWMPFDALWLIPDLREVGSGLPKLYGPADVATGLLIPLALAGAACRFRPGRPRAAGAAAACVLAGALLAGRPGPTRWNDADPFVAFLRQGVAQFAERYVATTDYAEIVALRDRSFPLAGAEYRYADPAAGLLLKVPVQAAPPARRLNVVLIVLESFRAYESGAYGARPSLTPSFDRLAEQSLVFEQFYANGVQTARGEFSLLASQYDNLGAGPHYVLHPFVHLWTLPAILKEYGYRTSQIQAYDGAFHNMRLFLTQHGVDRVYDWNDMPSGPTIGWGLNDVSMFDRALAILGEQPAPFFAEVLTLSSHFPFDAYPTDPDAPPVAGGETYTAYAHGIFYTDHALGHFMARARAQPWYADTVFVVTGDHGLFLFPDQPRLSRARRQEAAFRVPLLIHAPGRVAPGRRRVVGSQVDVAPTLLDLLGIRRANTFVGRSLLDDRIPADDRFAILVQQSNWFLRRGDAYYYCAGPDDHGAAALDFTQGYLEVLRGERTAIGFRTRADLLRMDPGDAPLLDAGEVRARRRWAEEVIEVAGRAVRHDWILANGSAPDGAKGNRASAIELPGDRR